MVFDSSTFRALSDAERQDQLVELLGSQNEGECLLGSLPAELLSQISVHAAGYEYSSHR